MFTIDLTPAARDDLDRTLDFVRMTSPQNADHLGDAVFAALNSLSVFPERCPLAVETKEWGYPVRSLLVYRFRVLYTIRDLRVVVLRIVHGAMNSPVDLP